MSYIRCLNNPEALYVWGGVDGNTHFSWQRNDQHHPVIGVPTSEVDKFFLELHKWETLDCEWLDTDNPFSHGNMSVVEYRMPTGTGKKDLFGDDEMTWRIKLTLGPNRPDLIMWGVTWDYLKNSFYEHLIADPWYCRWILKCRRLISANKRRRIQTRREDGQPM